MDREIDLVDEVLKAIPTEPLPDLGPAVMRRIEQQESKRTSITAWLWKPRPVVWQWRPAYALAMAAALAGILLLTGQPQSQSQSKVLVQFRLDAPNARQVTLAGDFTDWKPAHTMIRSQPGVWMVVVPLSPGVHDYAFVVDGERWTADPLAPAIADGFGGINSRLAVLSPEQKGI